MRRCALQGEGEIYMTDVFTVARKKGTVNNLSSLMHRKFKSRKL